MTASRARVVHAGAALVAVTAGPASVTVVCVAVTLLSLALAGPLSWLDRRLPPTPVRGAASAPAATSATAQ